MSTSDVTKTDGPLNLIFEDPHNHLGNSEAMRELVGRIIRLAVAKTPHRLQTSFDFVDGQLGVLVTLQRRHLGRWSVVRPGTWIPLTAQSNALYAMLLHVAEHGRLPDLDPAPGEPRP